jgi:hypothetical protein
LGRRRCAEPPDLVNRRVENPYFAGFALEKKIKIDIIYLNNLINNGVIEILEAVFPNSEFKAR